MSSTEIMNKNFAVRVLTSHVRKQRISSTYLFSGGSAADRERLALDFARAMNCEKGMAFETCECVSCHKAASGNHPDMEWIGRDLEARSLKISEARSVISNASFRPYESRYKIFIFCGADRLTADASNALLKLLEEPPANNIFILLVENKMHLLETIQSRSFEIRLGMGENADLGALLEIQELMTKSWPAQLESLQGLSREEALPLLESLASYQMQQIRLDRAPMESIRIVDKILETKDALESNVNVKLAFTRLMMHWQNVKASV